MAISRSYRQKISEPIISLQYFWFCLQTQSMTLHSSYLSQPPQPAVVYFLQAGVLFSSENAKGTAFSKVHSENINTNPHSFLMKIPNTPTQVLSARSHVTNTTSQCKGHLVRQPK